MAPDIILTLITLGIAIIGTLWKDPPTRAKAVLIALAVIASVLTIMKTTSDDSDKRFIKATLITTKEALVSTLVPSNSSYSKLIQDVEDNSGFRNALCHHNQDGMTCFLSSDKDPGEHAVLVINKIEIAEMYANEIERVSNRDKVLAMLSKSYDPRTPDDEFSDKVGLLGTAVWFGLTGRQADYAYDDTFGVKIIIDQNGIQKEVVLSPKELADQQGKARDLFYALQQRFEGKFKEQASELITKKITSAGKP